MNKETRIRKIQEIVDREKEHPFSKLEIPWEDQLQTMDVYKIPLEYLIYNKYNGRILSRTKSLENQKQLIDDESLDGKETIAKLLWDSKPERNKKTLESLQKGQEKPGIITRDGIIIDGNRRAMLLNKLSSIDYFKAVVLPVTLDENPLEIEKFETTYQLGEDQKLDYNPIEIYLKIQGLYKQLSKKNKYIEEDVDKKAIGKIYEWIGNYKTIKSVSDIPYMLSVMNTMDEYLDFLNYQGIYTALDDKEEQFRELTNWLMNFYGEQSVKSFDGYKNSDVDDLKTICFDFIRIKYKNEKFRYMGRGQRRNHFFGDKAIWTSFRDKHFEEIRKYTEIPIDFSTTNIEAHLNSRDSDFNDKIGKLLDENVDNHYQKLRNRQAADEPEVLITRSIDSFNSINTKHKSFSDPKVQKLALDFGNRIFSSIEQKSPSLILSHVIDLLEKIDLSNIKPEDVVPVKAMATKINQISYQLKRQL